MDTMPDGQPQKKRGCRRYLFIGSVGCLSIIILTVGVVGIGLLWASFSVNKLGDPTTEQASRVFAVSREGGRILGEGDDLQTGDDASRNVDTGAGTEGVTSDLAGDSPSLSPDSKELAAFAPARPMRLTIDMEEGEFKVIPGPPGSDITIDGTYADNYYELTDERHSGETGDEVKLTFQPTVGLLTRVLAGLTTHSGSHPNQLTVTIPEDLPVALDLRLSQGMSRSDLGGLTLTELDTHLSKGEHRLRFDRPTVGELSHMAITTEMGEFRVEDLGNARPLELEAYTRMGDFSIDLGGDWLPGTDYQATFSHSMGHLEVMVPDEVHVSKESTNMVIFGGSHGRMKDEEEPDPDAPRLTINMKTRFGDAQVSRR